MYHCMSELSCMTLGTAEEKAKKTVSRKEETENKREKQKGERAVVSGGKAGEKGCTQHIQWAFISRPGAG